MDNFEVVIGIEVHTALNTKTKMFSPSRNSHTSYRNSNVNEVDLALPGSMPQPNRAAIDKAILLATALGMDINIDNIQFDRKNYFYMDLPKGFQITQQHYPIGRNGYLDINVNDTKKRIKIERIHIEEDTAKHIDIDGKVMLDYNRAGSPLIEIVTEPVISSAVEATKYVATLRQVLKFINVSDAKMEEGSLRADVNISLRLYGQKELGTKVEVKNINSISNISKAIAFEIKRQSELLLTGQPVLQETRRFNDQKFTTDFMRAKTDAVDYRYMTEPNIACISLPKSYLKDVVKTMPKLPQDISKHLLKQKLDIKNVELLLDNFELYLVFDKVNQIVKDAPLTFKWIALELVGLLNKQQSNINSLSQKVLDNISAMIKLLVSQEINGKQAKTILEQIITNDEPVEAIIKRLGFVQIKDPQIIGDILTKVIADNPKMVEQYLERPERAEKFFMGMVMKQTQGQANPVVTIEVLKKLLQN